ncbi:hypothetical protein [Nocardia sp. NPDC050710]|uniref:hypothetical protein n=1 Tax=Nocardia sp. NPDC050710 TaxID=3157220 RepID=UPI0033C1E4C3
MMRAALGVLAVMGMIATAPTAFAAPGSIVVNGSVYRDPVSCLQVSGGPIYLAVENHTDTIVIVYSWPWCRGEVTAVLAPNQSATTTGASIQIS